MTAVTEKGLSQLWLRGCSAMSCCLNTLESFAAAHTLAVGCGLLPCAAQLASAVQRNEDGDLQLTAATKVSPCCQGNMTGGDGVRQMHCACINSVRWRLSAQHDRLTDGLAIGQLIID